MFDLEIIDFLSASFKNRSVMIVEDDLLLKPFLERVLHSVRGDVEVMWTTSFEQAEQLLRKRAVDLVISDCLLFGSKTGVDLWNYCRKKYPKIPFMLISGLQSTTIKGFAAGAKEEFPPFLQKPLFIGECRSAVQNLLEERKKEQMDETGKGRQFIAIAACVAAGLAALALMQ